MMTGIELLETMAEALDLHAVKLPWEEESQQAHYATRLAGNSQAGS